MSAAVCHHCFIYCVRSQRDVQHLFFLSLSPSLYTVIFSRLSLFSYHIFRSVWRKEACTLLESASSVVHLFLFYIFARLIFFPVCPFDPLSPKLCITECIKQSGIVTYIVIYTILFSAGNRKTRLAFWLGPENK